nr:hypothetical protein CFP56_32288 [Quercus suber]
MLFFPAADFPAASSSAHQSLLQRHDNDADVVYAVSTDMTMNDIIRLMYRAVFDAIVGYTLLNDSIGKALTPLWQRRLKWPLGAATLQRQPPHLSQILLRRNVLVNDSSVSSHRHSSCTRSLIFVGAGTRAVWSLERPEDVWSSRLPL